MLEFPTFTNSESANQLPAFFFKISTYLGFYVLDFSKTGNPEIKIGLKTAKLGRDLVNPKIENGLKRF